MAMKKRNSQGQQEEIWIAHAELARAPWHPLYERLNEVLESAGSDDFGHAEIDGYRYAPGGVRVGSGTVGVTRTAAGATAGDRCDDAGSERGDAVDCAAGHGRELRGVSAGAGEGFRDRNADAGGLGAAGPQAQEADCRTRSGRVLSTRTRGSRR